MSQRRVCQFSCGAASAVATKLTLAEFPDAVIINAFVKEENEDNRRFLADCEKWFERTVHVLRDEKYGASTDEGLAAQEVHQGKARRSVFARPEAESSECGWRSRRY